MFTTLHLFLIWRILSVLATCYAYRGSIVYNTHIREDSWINTQDRVLRSEPEPEPFKVHSSR